jgi:protocatechuate 3,4-dioxygenase beta subunit
LRLCCCAGQALPPPNLLSDFGCRFCVSGKIGFMRSVLVITLCLWWHSPRAGAAEKPGGAEGRVLDAGSGEPIRKAMVILRRNQESGAAAYTDSKGEFHFAELEPGAYALSATRDGYVASRKEPPAVVTVLPEKTQSDLTVKLVRTGVVSGRVLDSDGDPVENASVDLLAIKGEREGGSATTNDRGEYRVFGVPPGKYRLVAAANSRTAGELSLKLSGAEEHSYSWTYYPGTSDARRAATIEVSAGAELHGFDLALVRSRVVRVRGRVTGPADAPAPFEVMLGASGSESLLIGRSVQVRNIGGTFELTDVEPGAYVLSAMGVLQENRYYASRAIDVIGSDIEGIELALAAPQRITGRVILPEGRRMPPGLVAAFRPRERIVLMQGSRSPVAPDGTFHTELLPAGDYDISVTTGQADDLYLSAIRFGDQDVLAKGLHIGGASPATLEIVLAANGGALQAAVVNDKGDPIPQAHVILLPDPARRAQRAFRGDCTTEASGGCNIRGIAPGDYHAIAYANNPPFDVDEATIKEIEKYGKSVTISAGGQSQLTLQPVPDEE